MNAQKRKRGNSIIHLSISIYQRLIVNMRGVEGCVSFGKICMIHMSTVCMLMHMILNVCGWWFTYTKLILFSERIWIVWTSCRTCTIYCATTALPVYTMHSIQFRSPPLVTAECRKTRTKHRGRQPTKCKKQQQQQQISCSHRNW